MPIAATVCGSLRRRDRNARLLVISASCATVKLYPLPACETKECSLGPSRIGPSIARRLIFCNNCSLLILVLHIPFPRRFAGDLVTALGRDVTFISQGPSIGSTNDRGR